MDNTLNKDGMLRISLMGGQARAFLIDSTRLVEEARRIHSLSRTATAALGRALTGASMMGAMLKDERDSLTLMIRGGGPIGTVMAVARSDGSVKGYVDWPDTELERRTDGKLNVGMAVGREGRMSVVKDLGMKNPYVGQTALLSGEIAEDFAAYYVQSEQTPTLQALGVLVSGETVLSAGGVLLQTLPGCPDEIISQLELRSPLFSDISRELCFDSAENLLSQWFDGLKPVVLETRPLEYRCYCSRARMEKALIALGKDELTSMIEDEIDGAELVCHFCKEKYHFTQDDLRRLLEQATR